MKKTLAFLMCIVVLLICLCGCDAKNETVSSENLSTDSEGENSSEITQSVPSTNYWQEYEGTPPANKKYVIYSTPRSGVKEGIVNDPESDVLAVRNATKLYFGIGGCDIEQKPYTYIETKKYTDDSLPYYQVVEYRDIEYELMSNFSNNTNIATEKHTFNGQEYSFETQYDRYSVFKGDDALGTFTIRRDTGKVVDYKSNDYGKKPKDNITPISDDEARAKIVQYVRDFCGEAVAEDFKIESAELEKGNSTYSMYSYYRIGEYNTWYSFSVCISIDGTLLRIQMSSGLDALKKAVEEYGMEAFDKAKSVLESAVELPSPAQFIITFDSEGKLFLLVTTNQSYPQVGPPYCCGVHPMHYAVEILK